MGGHRSGVAALGCIGCAVLGTIAYLIIVIGAIIFILSIGLTAAATCVPSGFPHYPGSVWGGTSAGGTQCIDTEVTFGSADDIYAFYRIALTRPGGAWVAAATDSTAHVIQFTHTSGQKIVGTFWIVPRFGFNAYCRFFDRNPSASADDVSLFAVRRLMRFRQSSPICGGPPPPAQS